MGDIHFKVQIGAFKEDSIPQDLAELYLSIDDINESQENNLTVLQVGDYGAYQDAETKKMELVKLGIPGPFIVAYDSRQKISVKAAIKYVDRKKAEIEEKQSIEDDKRDKNSKMNDGKDKDW